MDNFNKFEVPINILTPVYIGTGETYISKEYFYSDDLVFRMNMSELFNSWDIESQKKFISNIHEDHFSLNDMEIDRDSLNTFSKYSMINNILNKPKFYNEFECATKSSNKLYIPGSSIKGSIKNALLFNSIQTNEIPNMVSKISNYSYGNILDSYFSLDFLEHPAQSSILRFLQISDTNVYEGKPHLHEIIQLSISKGKYPKLIEQKMGKRYVETIPKLTKSNLLKISITTDYNNKVFSKLNYDESIKNLLNINKIAESLALFADIVIEYEIEFFSKYHNDDLVNFYENLIKYNYFNKPLILLGSGTGVHTKTIFLKIKEYDNENGTNLSKIFSKKLFGSKNNVFPKSRKIINKLNQPLGWAQLDLSDYISK